METWEDTFRHNSVDEVRQKFKQLTLQKSSFTQEASTILGGSYPEILQLCSSIRGLTSLAAKHETDLVQLSSIENNNKWTATAQSVALYASREHRDARANGLKDLITYLNSQIDLLVADGEYLQASRSYYLLTELGAQPPPGVLDRALEKWLEDLSSDSSSLLAYIVRFKVPPSTLARKLAQHRLTKIAQLSVLDAVEFVDQTLFTLQYISDYELKFRKSPAKLVDSLDLDLALLPAEVFEVPLFPSECFEATKRFSKHEFQSEAYTMLEKMAREYVSSAEASSVVKVLSSLVRDSPQLAASILEACINRLQAIVRDTAHSLVAIELPLSIENEEQRPLDNLITSTIEGTRGQLGSMRVPITETRKWISSMDALSGSLDALGAIKTKMPLEAPVKALNEQLQSEKVAAIAEITSKLPENPIVSILFVKSLGDDPELLAKLYLQLAESFFEKWELAEGDIGLPAFPQRALLLSMKRLVELMDNVALFGIVFDEAACTPIRAGAFDKLSAAFPDDVPFLEAALKASLDTDPTIEQTLNRVRRLLQPLVH